MTHPLIPSLLPHQTVKNLTYNSRYGSAGPSSMFMSSLSPLSFISIIHGEVSSSEYKSYSSLIASSVMETLDPTELLIEDQVWLNYLWDFETRGIDLDFSSMLSSPGLDTD